MKNLARITFVAAAVAMLPALSHAENSILASLQAQGIQTVVMTDQSLSEAKGAARITGQPLPSVTVGVKTYQVTWNKLGSQTDYRS
jgi:predicted NAD/FAD-binding protein